MIFFKSKNNNHNTPETQPETASQQQVEITPKVAVEPTPAQPRLDRKSPEFMALVKEEAKKLRILEQQLSESHLARIEDSLRLSETKMENIEDNLKRARSQKERLKRYQEILIELKEQKEHLYELNKLQASNIKERELLERFEAFENVLGQYQRLTVLENLRREQKQRLSTLTRDVSDASKVTEEERKRLEVCQDELKESMRRMMASLDAYGEAQMTEGKKSLIDIVIRHLNGYITEAQNKRDIIDHNLTDIRTEAERLQGILSTLRTRRQSIELHASMVEHAELVLERLSQLSSLEEEMQRYADQQSICLRRQTDENILLERVYADYQQATQAIDSTKDELAAHRQQNHGLNSYRLQERTMQKTLRRAMLNSAQSLWVRLAQGYEMIEDRLQLINSLRLKQEDLSKKISELERDLTKLRVTCKDKEYTFTLSKSQNVIQLRSDLKEGTSCTVCGATHHPYHSDTMLEQNKLIGEMKTEMEGLSNELQQKERTLLELKLEHSAVTAKREEAENTLIVLRELQNRFTQDWQMYVHLDPTFAQCDSSTNAPARAAMLHQLIENIEEEVETSKKELDTFNFHQQRINELTEKLAVQEQKKADIVTRLNEVNTGCQVLAVQLERANTMKQLVTAKYEQLFEVLDKMITIHDWKTTWKRSHEALIMRIQEYTKEWFDLVGKIEQNETALQKEQLALTNNEENRQNILADLAGMEENNRHYNDMREEAQKQIEKLAGKETPKFMMQRIIDENLLCAKAVDKQRDTFQAASLHHKEMLGRQTENIENGNLTDEKVSTERQNVDLWMRRYNANHPPVQYNELDVIFGEDRNWNDIREHVRSIEIDSILTQQRVDKLRSRLVALQAEGNISDTNPEIQQEQLNAQIETLETRRQETMMTVAQLSHQLKTHHTAVEMSREERMKEKTNPLS